jgi:hypothetical protein
LDEIRVRRLSRASTARSRNEDTWVEDPGSTRESVPPYSIASELIFATRVGKMLISIVIQLQRGWGESSAAEC